jgi:membrane protein DedA with SNARE-associated domain
MTGGLVDTLLGVLTGLGYPGIATIVGLESAGLPLPGETMLLTASYLASTGHLSLPLVIAAAALGAVIGDSVGYLVGRKGGRRFLERYGRYAGITPEKLAKAEGYFTRHGGKTVFFGRFVAVLRILAGPLAGTSNMPYRRFLVANVVGAVSWATVMGTLGFFFGKPVAAILGHLGIWALVALAAFLILRFALRRWRSRGRRAPQTSPSATTEVGPPAELMAKPVAARVR